MSCFFDVNDIKKSLELLKESLFDRLSPIPDYGLTNTEDIKLEILKQISDISESFLIKPDNVDTALMAFEDDSLFWGMEEATPSKEELKEAMISWMKEESKNMEDTSTARLNNAEKNIERVKDDPIGFAYGRALKAKIRATQHANTVGVHSILYNLDGIINTEEDLNQAITTQLEQLLENVLNFLRNKGISIEGKMYNDGNYTGIVEEIESKYGKLFKYDFNELNELYNNNEFKTLDAISSWVILTNFDTILKDTFGKAINVNPDKSKYDSTKYSVSGGSNVYTTWRTNEEIDLAKEINNISLAIITSIPYYKADTESPSEGRNLKFNEFVYLISKIKDIPHHLKNEVVFNILEGQISEEARNFLNGKTLSNVINTLRDNPLEYLSLIIEAINNKNIFELISSNLSKSYFVSIDRDIINTIYLGIFSKSNPNSLNAILTKSGFKNINYYSFITLTVDSTFKANFLLYFRNPEGEIYVRLMYDLSLYSIGENIKSNINNFSALLSLLDYNFEDNASDINIENLSAGSNYFKINGTEYNVSVLLDSTGKKTLQYLIDNKNVTDKNVIDELNKLLKAKYSNPSIISFTYDEYHKGPLKVEINLLNGKITYFVNGIKEDFSSKKDFDSLLPLIENTLKLNFDIDSDYLNAYLNLLEIGPYISPYGDATRNLMQLTSRVLFNKYIQENYIKHLPYSNIRKKINDIFGEPRVSYKPTYNNKIHELNYLTDAETPIINILAQAKALVTGRLTSSQILDGDGNALASSSLSRLQSSLDYQVEVQVKLPDAAAKDFTLWKPGVYKGIYQLKEMKDNTSGISKSHTGFSNKEMENSLVFIDFLQGLITKNSTRSPYTDGVVGFYPSENSDKTYVGRILIDLLAIPFGESNLYELIREHPENIAQFYPIIRLELGNYYLNALNNINSEWAKFQELGLNISYGNWSDLDNATEIYNSLNEPNLKPIEFLKQLVTEYNFNHPFNPITLIENVHYVEDSKGNLMRNSSFMANLLRFSSDESFSSFIMLQEKEVLENLLQDGVSVDATPELEKLLGKEWIDKQTNKVILAKLGTSNIRRYRDYDSNELVILNPLLSSYNLLNYFFTLEYMNSSVGAYYAHPNKKSTDIYQQMLNGEISPELALNLFLQDEKVRKLAQDKRNVSFTAAMHAMQKNLILGIPEIANIAIMPDVKDEFETISGDFEGGIKPYDGATFTNPFFSILLNYSLGGAKVGKIKKTFTHYYDEKTGTGGIIKTAEFSLTNEYIRRSKFYKTMMLNMTDRVWRDKNGLPCTVDITTDYEGNSIIFHNSESDLGYMYFLDDATGDYYVFTVEKGDLPNTYIRTIQKVDLNGQPTEDEPIKENWTVNTNFDLWRMFGGERSVSFNRGLFFPSEHSITQVVEIMNKTTTAGTILKNVRTLKDVWQPLKHSDIHIMPTSGAVKLGAANVNNVDSYTNADSKKINHFRIRMNQVGVQLDKEHHADGEDLSIMTQVLSACAARGYTQEMTLNLYNAMAQLAEAGIRPYLKNFELFFKVSENPKASAELLEKARQDFENTLLDTLIRALANSTNTSATLQIVTQELLEKAKEGKVIDFAKLNVPLSDPAVMRKLHSTISVALTKAAIKIKVDGNLNMLCPSYGIVKVYDGKMYEDFLNDKEILDEQAAWNKNPASELVNNTSQIRLGRTYKIINSLGLTELRTLKTAKDYYLLKNDISNGIVTSVKELFAPVDELGFEGGRELGSYNVTFSGNIQIFTTEGIQEISGSFNLYDLVSVKNLHDLKTRGNYTKAELDEALAAVLEDLNVLHSKQGEVLTDKGIIRINPTSVNIEPYEIVMPKIFATIFGLTENDNLDAIRKDPNFFTKRLIKNLSPKHSDYTICLQRINGNHIYVLNSDDAVQTKYFKPKLILRTRENGKLYRQYNGELLYELGENDLVWEKINSDGTITEVIVTDSPLSYIDRVDYITLNLNTSKENSHIIEELKKSKNKSVLNYLEAINLVTSRIGETLEMAIEDILEINLHNLEDSPVGNWYKKLGNEIYASFLKSLEVVAARIPAQSMQSFMPMKVVGFEKSDINTAYVSTALILFLGSDYDIDAVSIASFAFDNSGRYITHSPLANIQSYLLLKASENLPFPTGKELEIDTEELFDYSPFFAPNGPFVLDRGNIVRINNSTPENIEILAKFIDQCNKLGYIPSSSDPSLSLAVNSIRGYINRHNNYINTSKDVEKFSKNYMVTSMYNIGLSPANLIESQQAMDSITGPLKEVASQTLKALELQSSNNPANYTTNIRGFVLNMDGKQGVGICAVGLKGFFAATARYNDILNNGTPEEVERLKSDVEIAGKHFRILANAYSKNEVNKAILGEIITLLDLGKDSALILSGLLSLATDNAKELALTKLNAANMLGMYIYGIAIGMNFKDIAKIIASKTGQVVDSLIKEDVITGERGMNMENIFDYLELGPKFNLSEKVSAGVKQDLGIFLNLKILRDLAWERAYIQDDKVIYLEKGLKMPLNVYSGLNLIAYYESKKRDPGTTLNPYYKGNIEFNRYIEKAQDYILQIHNIINDSDVFVDDNGAQNLVYYNGGRNSGIYGNLKKLLEGGEELRRLGQLLHINLGNETSYVDALGYIDKLESAISSAQYRKYREFSRYILLKGNKAPTNYSKQYEINFHKFVTIPNYREGCIDLYEGVCKEELFKNSESYREMFLKALNIDEEFVDKQYEYVVERIKPSKTFFNILDILNVPHYFLYLRSADMLHQYMQNSIKYRGIYNLGKTAIEEIGAYSQKDRESIFRRTEQFLDRILRDRFFISKEINFEIPVNKDFFIKDGNTIKRVSSKNSPAIIKLGTREGNASFKLLMEEVIIPELKKMDRFKDNKFIQSLGTVLFSANPELLTTRCIAPSINMSPRSDTDSALFEEVKHDFNNLRTSDYRYLSGGIKHNLIDLFYYYNLIAFGGRIGENTMANIFLDVLDFGNIKGFRDYESYLDKYGDLGLITPDNPKKGTISLNTLLRETAPRAFESSTKLNYFYSENWRTGELSFNERNSETFETHPETGEKIKAAKYIHNPVAFTSEENSKDFLVLSTDSDITTVKTKLSGGLNVEITFEKGSITDIKIDEQSIEIPTEDKVFFRNLKTVSRLRNGILEKYYNKGLILSKIEEIINCK